MVRHWFTFSLAAADDVAVVLVFAADGWLVLLLRFIDFNKLLIPTYFAG